MGFVRTVLNNVGGVGRSVTGQGVESTKNDPAAGALVPSSPEQRHREVGAQHLSFSGLWVTLL